MNTQEITNLINIRDYICNAVNNFSIDNKVARELNGMLILVDKKIVALLMGTEFKDYISYANVKEAIQEVAIRNNIKSGLKV